MPWSWLAAIVVVAAAVLLLWPDRETLRVAPASEPLRSDNPAVSADPAPAALRREAASVAPPAAAAALAVATGALQIAVVSEVGQPLAGCALRVAGDEGPAATTDVRGQAELTLSCGSHVLEIAPPDRRFAGTSGRVAVEPGTHAFTVVLTMRGELPFCARLLAGEPPAPVAGAQAMLFARDERVDEQVTGATGLLQVLAESRDATLQIAASDAFGPCLVVPMPGHETAALAMQVVLPPAATLRVRVIDGAERPLPGIAVSVAMDRQDVTLPAGAYARRAVAKFTAETDAAGEVLAPRLAAGARAVVQVQHGRVPVSGELRLAPGANLLTLRAEDCILRGRLLDLAGAPLGGVEVGVQHWPEGDAPRVMRGAAGAAGNVRTAADGTFAFDRLGPGFWLVGVLENAAAEPALEPVCQRVELRPGSAAEVELRAGRGGLVAGTALLPDGTPAVGVGLDLMTPEPGLEYVTGTRTGADGSFRIGPLPPGEWSLHSEVFGGVFGIVRPLSARTGDTGLRLQLARTMAAVQAQVVDAVGRPRRAWLFMLGAKGDALAFHTGLDGRFAHEGLRPGSWALYADDGCGGVAILFDVDLQPAATPTLLQLQLAPGGTVVLRCPNDTNRSIVCRQGDRIGYRDDVGPGEIRRIMLPPGRWQVELRMGIRLLRQAEVIVVAGGAQELAWQ